VVTRIHITAVARRDDAPRCGEQGKGRGGDRELARRDDEPPVGGGLTDQGRRPWLTPAQPPPGVRGRSRAPGWAGARRVQRRQSGEYVPGAHRDRVLPCLRTPGCHRQSPRPGIEGCASLERTAVQPPRCAQHVRRRAVRPCTAAAATNPRQVSALVRNEHWLGGPHVGTASSSGRWPTAASRRGLPTQVPRSPPERMRLPTSWSRRPSVPTGRRRRSVRHLGSDHLLARPAPRDRPGTTIRCRQSPIDVSSVRMNWSAARGWCRRAAQPTDRAWPYGPAQ